MTGPGNPDVVSRLAWLRMLLRLNGGPIVENPDAMRVLANAMLEIETLRGQVRELLPFAESDARLGVTVGPADDCSFCRRDGGPCPDCDWYEQSLVLLSRIEAKEFGVRERGSAEGDDEGDTEGEGGE